MLLLVYAATSHYLTTHPPSLHYRFIFFITHNQKLRQKVDVVADFKSAEPRRVVVDESQPTVNIQFVLHNRKR